MAASDWILTMMVTPPLDTATEDLYARLADVETQLAFLADAMRTIVLRFQVDRREQVRILSISENARTVLGIFPEESLINSEVFFGLIVPADRDRLMLFLKRFGLFRRRGTMDLRIMARGGDRVWLRFEVKPVITDPECQDDPEDDGIQEWHAVATDITDRKAVEQELMYQAYFDRVTQLGNESLFKERFKRAVGFSQAEAIGIHLLVMSVDRFAFINATYGYAVGDMVLKAVGERLQSMMLPGDLVCRGTGDRFLIVLTGFASDEDAAVYVKHLQEAFRVPVACDDVSVDVSLSAGVAPHRGEAVEDLLMHAENALQKAKEGGLGNVRVFDEDLGVRARNAMAMRQRLRGAIEAGEFRAFFQPQVEPETGRIVGMEALARWCSPTHGLITPGAFIGIAEEFGLIDAIYEQVLQDACAWNARWLRKGLLQVPVAVNVSGRQFHNSRLLVRQLRDALEQSGLPARFLEIELTESSAMLDPENAVKVLSTLRDQGIACSIDDFGTGYSSLAVLKRFPLSKLKIDQSFVRGLAETGPRGEDAAIIKATIAMARSLGLKVVVEGVETASDLLFLKDAGCQILQGYYLSKPLAGHDLETILMTSGATIDLGVRDSGSTDSERDKGREKALSSQE